MKPSTNCPNPQHQNGYGLLLDMKYFVFTIPTSSETMSTKSCDNKQNVNHAACKDQNLCERIHMYLYSPFTVLVLDHLCNLWIFYGSEEILAN